MDMKRNLKLFILFMNVNGLIIHPIKVFQLIKKTELAFVHETALLVLIKIIKRNPINDNFYPLIYI